MILIFFFFTFPKTWVGRAMGNGTFCLDGLTPFKFLPTFPQKIYGVADTVEEVDMQLKFTFFFTVISRSFFTENPMVDP